MSKDIWIPLNRREKALLIDALKSGRTAKAARSSEIDALVSKLVAVKSSPRITVRVEGGMVQCASGNPFPIRICDYDIQGQENPDVDERGDRCRISFEPADPEIGPPARRRKSKSHSRRP